MKKETIAKNWPSLTPFASQFADEKRRSIFELLQHLFEFGYCRPCYTTGRGRFTRIHRYNKELVEIVDKLGYKLVELNDAPRGGQTGDILAFVADVAGCKAVVTVEDEERFFHVCADSFNTKKLSSEVCGGVLFSHYDKCENIYIDSLNEN